MSFNADVLQVMIASPSDVNVARQSAKDAMSRWNDDHSKRQKVVLLPVGWDTHATPKFGVPPQDSINHDLLADADILIAVFGSRIGTRTSEFLSGTVEELERHVESGKPALVYFSNSPIERTELDVDQYKALQQFREYANSRGLVSEYSTALQLSSLIYSHLNKLIDERTGSANEIDGGFIGGMESSSTNRLDKEAKLALIATSEATDGALLAVQSHAGLLVQVGGSALNSESDPRSEARWMAALEQLEQNDLLRAANSKREVFRLTSKGYEMADRLRKTEGV